MLTVLVSNKNYRGEVALSMSYYKIISSDGNSSKRNADHPKDELNLTLIT